MKLLALLALVVVLFIVTRPNTLPISNLNVHDMNTDSIDSANIGECLSDKCLIIYVAPWCPICHKITPTIIALVNEMKAEGIQVDVVVGKDKPNAVLEYAEHFPFPVALDANGRYFYAADIEAVPYFVAINYDGEILNEMYGGYQSVSALRNKLEI
ncbi:MAG: TlpA family protein disulfide reductase [Saccharospirillaceae bacterium]|nr:TlpA family protein disulfide reductase [Pseudomonadales bacterium]NRB79805.1 TlpA family protein disulfide reductase [Saccharospirillaceae bacterium]